ncbi:fatty acid synthase S-acetyltransferase [Metarhizium acridum CQMa 102]|uniref:Fatty acid synthase S-acetyltransferase n=1 Tax=Metarhizium acridum (strain CQMa 102) TaxID=655827 RepID=E9EE02_METAQ|nr:fatty acid synthase S-acetyltransferase [Metarhizium acridum CQMa 102]EFY85841.1 fatty acid synthase S-acetyltransferase [Metarhizium acridum CQMa 102]
MHRLLNPQRRLFLEEHSPVTHTNDCMYLLNAINAMFVNHLMTFYRILPGWWLGAGDNQPFTSPQRWTKELLDVGFSETESIILNNSALNQINTGIIVSGQKAKASLCVPIGDSMTFKKAAAVLLVYATALIALVDKANFQQDQSVLIDAARGGVGLAAVQITQTLEAKIYRTAGSDAKRDYLMNNYKIPATHISIHEIPPFSSGYYMSRIGKT